MTTTRSARPANATTWLFARSILAATAAAGFFATIIIAPFSTSEAAAQQEFNARIHQEFVPEVVEEASVELVTPTIEEIPKPEPEPVPPTSQASFDAAPPLYTGGGSPAQWMAAAGIAESDWGYVDYIVSRESGWNPNAINSSGGYCGLVQIAPMHGVANCTDPVVNLQWATGYANGRYGSWKGAWEHWAKFQNGW